MKKLIITGGSGFIGNQLILKLSKEYRLLCLVRASSKQLDRPNIEYTVIDFMRPNLQDAFFKNVFAVIHLLSVKHSNDQDIWTVNVDFTRSLVNVAKRNGVLKFFYMSSETVLLPGSDRYSQSKARAEQEVRKHDHHLILRPTVVYGDGDSSNIGLLAQLIKYSRVVPVIGDGSQLLQPVCVKSITKCIAAGLSRDITGAHLIAGRDPITYLDIVKTIAKAYDKKILILHIPISLAYLITTLFGLLSWSILQKSQIDNLGIDRTYSMKATGELFGVGFTNPREGIRRVAK
jgi:nucleoside-diphosphate-sugar epimerase